MKACQFFAIAVCCLAFSIPPSQAQSEKERPVTVKLGNLPDIKLSPREPLSKDKIEEIKKCIAELANIASPNVGYSGTMSGSAFLPLPGREAFHSFPMTDHKHAESEPLKKLVEYGPDALPYLLENLDNKTPTKLKLVPEEYIGGMCLNTEMSLNRANEAEVKFYKEFFPNSDKDLSPNPEEKRIDEYTLKVGDLCFVAIGQITGRNYRAVRYQMTAHIVVNSPTESEKLRGCVRKIWASDNPRQKLFDYMKIDYATSPITSAPKYDDWWAAEHVQIESTLRLLYYYPKESKEVIVQRLKKLDVMDPYRRTTPKRDVQDFVRRELSNGGVHTSDYLESVAWTKDSEIRSILRDICLKTDDVEIFLTSLSVLEDKDSERIMKLIGLHLFRQPAEEVGDYWGSALLSAAFERYGEIAAPLVRTYLKDAKPQRFENFISAAHGYNGNWLNEFYLPMLEDKRGTGDDHEIRIVVPIAPIAPNSPKTETRVCDLAAQALAGKDPELKFNLISKQEDLDKQIEVIQKKLKVKK